VASVFHFVGFETHLARGAFVQTFQPVAQAYARMGARVELNAPLGRVGALPYAFVAKYEWAEAVFRARFGDRAPSDAGADPVRGVQLGFYAQAIAIGPALTDAPRAIAFFDAGAPVQALVTEWQAKKAKARFVAVYQALAPGGRYAVAAEAKSLLGGDDVSGLFAPLQPRAVGVYRIDALPA
jgi:hypothetical protein